MAQQPQPGRRALSASEIQQLQRELKLFMDKLPENSKQFPVYRDHRSRKEKEQFETFQGAWALRHPLIAPYLGHRAVTNSLTVFPSYHERQVCVAYTWGDTAEGIGHFGSVLTVGQVRDGEIRTQNNEILFLQGPYLVMFVVDAQNKPMQLVFPHPEPLPTFRPELSNLSPEFTQKLQQLGCTAEFPKS
jgi:hypothetical protein